MREYAFVHVDVFTETPFEGNPLAVFLDGRGLDAAEMQRIAREMNLSETVFVLPPSRAGSVATARIFTPAAEMAFAGHPTVGCAYVLHSKSIVRAAALTLDEGVGPVAVRIDEGPPFYAWLTTPPVEFGAPYEDRAGAARALGITEGALLAGAPIQVASAGNPFVFVALRKAADVDRCALDPRRAHEIFGDAADSGVYAFALQEGGAYSRMFAPDHGIIEDPATGSATGPLAAYLLRHRLVEDRDPLDLIAQQGVAMGRRSVLRIRVTGADRERRIEVGGSVCPLIEGVLRVP